MYIQIIQDAERDGYTLVSTWELYKITRLLQEKLVTFEDIHELLHTKGLFQAIPKSWSYLGDIGHMYNKNQEGNIVCFNLEADLIEKGDKLVINNGNEYFT